MTTTRKTARKTARKSPSSKPRADVYQLVTDRIIALLDAGTIPWRKTWKGGALGAPRSLVSNKPYRGINVWLLALTAQDEGYTSPYWLTFKQAKTLGGSVRKGERGTKVVLWKPMPKKDAEGKPVVGPTGKPESFMLIRQYTVFNLDQTEGCRIPKGRITERPDDSEFNGEAHSAEAVENAVAIFEGYCERESISVGHGGTRAYFSPKDDAIQLPRREDFVDGESYATTAFHEATHSTGVASRLDRKGITEFDFFGSHQYADEELVAEFGASFLCAVTGVERDATVENSAAYIAGWRKRLEDDPKVIVYAAQRGQKAADFIIGDVEADESSDEE